MNYNLIILVFLAIGCASCTNLPESQSGSMGFAISPKGGCSFTPPSSWKLDTKSGKSQGALVVAYPDGSTYANSPVIIYSRTLPRDSQTKSAANAAAAVVKHFHSNGHSNYQSRFVKTINTGRGHKGEIYAFSGDNWNNYEAACYFVEDEIINSIVYHAREQAVYNHMWPDFITTCRSYLPVFVGQ